MNTLALWLIVPLVGSKAFTPPSHPATATAMCARTVPVEALRAMPDAKKGRRKRAAPLSMRGTYPFEIYSITFRVA